MDERATPSRQKRRLFVRDGTKHLVRPRSLQDPLTNAGVAKEPGHTSQGPKMVDHAALRGQDGHEDAHGTVIDGLEFDTSRDDGNGCNELREASEAPMRNGDLVTDTRGLLSLSRFEDTKDRHSILPVEPPCKETGKCSERLGLVGYVKPSADPVAGEEVAQSHRAARRYLSRAASVQRNKVSESATLPLRKMERCHSARQRPGPHRLLSCCATRRRGGERSDARSCRS